jgi:hypothetical protein
VLATLDAEMMEKIAGEIKDLAMLAEVGKQVADFNTEQIYKKSFGSVGQAYDLMRITLNKRYGLSFQDHSGDAKRTKPAAKSKQKSDDDAKSEDDEGVDEEKEKQAANKLKVAKQLVKSKPAAAKDLLEKITSDFPGTKAAAEAEDLLDDLDSK